MKLPITITTKTGNTCTLKVVDYDYVMTGATGTHKLYGPCTDEKRLMAHWSGFVQNNGGLQPTINQKERQYRNKILQALFANGPLDCWKLQEMLNFQFCFLVRLEQMAEVGLIIYDPWESDTVYLVQNDQKSLKAQMTAIAKKVNQTSGGEWSAPFFRNRITIFIDDNRDNDIVFEKSADFTKSEFNNAKSIKITYTFFSPQHDHEYAMDLYAQRTTELGRYEMKHEDWVITSFDQYMR